MLQKLGSEYDIWVAYTIEITFDNLTLILKYVSESTRIVQQFAPFLACFRAVLVDSGKLLRRLVDSRNLRRQLSHFWIHMEIWQ